MPIEVDSNGEEVAEVDNREVKDANYCSDWGV